MKAIRTALPVLAVALLAACSATDVVAPVSAETSQPSSNGGIIGSGNAPNQSTTSDDGLGTLGSGSATGQTTTSDEEDSAGTLGSGSRSGYAIGGI